METGKEDYSDYALYQNYQGPYTANSNLSNDFYTSARMNSAKILPNDLFDDSNPFSSWCEENGATILKDTSIYGSQE